MRGQRQVRQSLTCDCWGSDWETSCMAGAACSAGIVKLEWQETGGSLAGRRGGGRGEERSGECGRERRRRLLAGTLGGGPLLQSPVTCSRGNQPISSVLASRPEPNQTIAASTTHILAPARARFALSRTPGHNSTHSDRDGRCSRRHCPAPEDGQNHVVR